MGSAGISPKARHSPNSQRIAKSEIISRVSQCKCRSGGTGWESNSGSKSGLEWSPSTMYLRHHLEQGTPSLGLRFLIPTPLTNSAAYAVGAQQTELFVLTVRQSHFPFNTSPWSHGKLCSWTPGFMSQTLTEHLLCATHAAAHLSGSSPL